MRASFRKHGCKNARSRVNTIIQAKNARCVRLNAAYDRAERGRIKKLGLLNQASGVTGIVFGWHDKKSSRRLRPNRN